jgi:hypothetical protein
MDWMVSSCAVATAKVDKITKAERKNLFTGWSPDGAVKRKSVSLAIS